jgi:hypothetical protein
MKGNTPMKKIFLFLSMFIVVTLACDLMVTVNPSDDPAPMPTSTYTSVTDTPTQIPPTVVPTVIAPTAVPPSATALPPTAIPATPPPSNTGTSVNFWPLSLVLPSNVANGASGEQIPRLDGDVAAWWRKTPGHLQVMLDNYYILQGRALQPRIYVYPAMDYAQLVPVAFESIHRLDNILYGPSAPITSELLPPVPFFNAQQVFASNIQVISFQNGSGVRFLTEYAQYPASANNHDLFYNFQGVTRDGVYYVVAILPITAPSLAATSDAGAPLPPGGISYPYMADPDANMQAYYAAVTTLLNATPSNAFTPAIGQLDALIQSMLITP